MMNTRVKDIDFKSADHVIEEIRNMNVKGGSPFVDLQHGLLNWLLNKKI